MARFFNCTALIISSLLILAADTCADPPVSERGNGSQQAHSVILRTSLSYEPIYIVGAYAELGGTAGIFWDNKLTGNFKSVVSPYIGVTMGIGDAFYFFGSAGVEKAFVYNSGFSITPSLGIHAGICGIDVSGHNLAGVHALAEIAFSRGRFSPYLAAGIRYTHIFDADIGDGLSFPLGAGLLLRI